MRPYTFTEALALDPAIRERFWANVVITEECWVWTGNCLPLRPGKTLDRGGYGQIHMNCGPEGQRYQVQMYAHRLSFLMHRGPIPPGLLVCHKCDNPPCIRPDHLFAGTASDNTQDMWNKGRGVEREPEDLKGQRFGKLLILGGEPGAWDVACDCGRRIKKGGPRSHFEARPDCGCDKRARILTLDGISHTEAEWAALLHISRQALDQRLDNGWPLERALTTPRSQRAETRYGKRSAA